MVSAMGAETGVTLPVPYLALTATSYVTPGLRPLMGQSLGPGHVTTMAGPPPTGVAVNVKSEKGPPLAGGLALTRAVLGVVGKAEGVAGALHHISQTSD